MVLQTERYPSGYHQNNYSAYQGPNGSYSSYRDETEHSSPYMSYPQMSTYSSSHAQQQQQSGWSNGGDYHSSGPTTYPGSGLATPVNPTNGGYGSSHGYGNSHSHGNQYGQSHGNQHGHGHGGPLGQGYGAPQSHGYGNAHGFGGGATSPFDKLTNRLSGYGNGNHNYGHTHSGLNHGYQKPSWTLKNLDDDE